jgi:uncharacterized protein (TIGR02147 family)
VTVARPGDIDVFDYLDYRAFLRDFYVHRKQTQRGFSHRAFSRRAGLASPNHLKRVMEGDRNLTAEMATRFAKACGLDGEAAEYFENLVAFNQARSATERNGHYARLTGYRQYKKLHKLELAHAAYHATWYLPAIRELAGRKDFQADPTWIAKQLVPPITAAEAKRALATIRELGLLQERDDGQLVRSEAVVSTGSEMPALHVANYHRAMMERAAASIDIVPSASRDISSLTMCLDEDGLRRVKERIQRFRRELIELEMLVDEPAQVIQINFQLFPLSVPPGEEV